MRAFPYTYRKSWLLDECNHKYTYNDMFKFPTTTWRVATVGEEDWIEADAGTDAEKHLQFLCDATKAHPPLCEMDYAEERFNLQLDAIRRRAEQLGTIIYSSIAVYGAIVEAGKDVIEDEPRKFIVMMSDDEFKELIKTNFPQWEQNDD